MTDNLADPDIRQQLEEIKYPELPSNLSHYPDIPLDVGHMMPKEVVDQILALISQTVNSVIGEDEHTTSTKSPSYDNNLLRAEQRATAQRLLVRETSE